MQKSLDHLQVGIVFRFAEVRPRRKHPLAGRMLVVLKRQSAVFGRAEYIVVREMEEGCFVDKPVSELPHPYHIYKLPLSEGLVDGCPAGEEPSPLQVREFFPQGQLVLQTCCNIHDCDVVYLRKHGWVWVENVRKPAICNKQGVMEILATPIGPRGIIAEDPIVRIIEIPYDDLLSFPMIQCASPMSRRARKAVLPRPIK